MLVSKSQPDNHYRMNTNPTRLYSCMFGQFSRSLQRQHLPQAEPIGSLERSSEALIKSEFTSQVCYCNLSLDMGHKNGPSLHIMMLSLPHRIYALPMHWEYY